MARAVVAGGGNGLEGIEVIDVESRPPGPGEVVVAVEATAISPFDLKRAGGLIRDPASVPPLRLGNEASGVVTATGPQAIGFEGEPLTVGDEVFGHWIPGAQASELTVPAALLLRRPAALGFVAAAALLGSGTAAEHAVVAADVGSNDVVLVHGASGSVGGMAARLARLRGAHVIGTAAQMRHGKLRAAGVEPVTYGPGLEERVRELAPGGVTAAIDAVGTEEAIAVSVALVPDRRRIVTLANFGAALAEGAQALGPGPDTERIRTAARLGLTRLAAAGDLVVDVVAEFPLEKPRDAYALLAGGHAGGKIVLRP
ncbi:alcohol dehydrogenase catalytic domain-containing protein [Pseudonocardia xinjiangensis]|uniref:alcohol dehydrogenase catalytic domain-containing protein n=1 Tax=Pseudonocardia xinjiangensis TaxID=75289 RepID=UPI003D91A3B6